MIAALYVQKNGCYSGLDGVDPWDEQRDARLYRGPHAVVAHPPCSRWCRLAGLVEARYGYKRGEDGGCFASALASVRKFGGVLEHPAYSDAWAAHGLTPPPTGEGWHAADFQGGWACYVEQWRYGHAAKKATWLYVFGVELQSMRWGRVNEHRGHALISFTRNRYGLIGRAKHDPNDKRRRLGPREASASPPEFRDVLVNMARSVARPAEVPLFRPA